MKMPSYTIRPAVLADYDSLLRIAARMAESGLPPWREREKALAWHRAEAQKLLSPAHPETQLLVAEGEAGILGFICFYPELDFLTGEIQGYVADLAVDAAAEGQGIGKALLGAAETWCAKMGFRFLALDVFAMNAAARAFYSNRGFVEQTVKMVKALARET